MILGEQTTWGVKEVSRKNNIPPTFQFIFSKNWKICCICNTCGSFLSPNVRKSRFRNLGTFACGIQNHAFLESGIPLTIRIQNLSSTEKYWNPVPGIRNPQRGIQNPRLSWISLHGTILNKAVRPFTLAQKP